MLRSIVPGLEDRTISGQWIYWTDRGQITSIRSLGGVDGDKRIDWQHATEADFEDFVDSGLFRGGQQGGYGPITQKIIDAVNSKFGENEQSQFDGATSSISFDPIFGAPALITQYKADIFVMMPFKDVMKHVYDDGMKPAAQALNLSINRGDDFFTKHTIMTDIWSAICHCRLVIADCTGKNANVFYELGMAHTVGKPVIMIAQNENDIPFDIR